MQLSDRIGRRLKLHDLHVLLAVVQAGSMRKAAALLNTTQPDCPNAMKMKYGRSPLGAPRAAWKKSVLDKRSMPGRSGIQIHPSQVFLTFRIR